MSEKIKEIVDCLSDSQKKFLENYSDLLLRKKPESRKLNEAMKSIEQKRG